MAWTYTLRTDDSGTVLALNDGTNYSVQQDGFNAPAPARRMAVGGQSLFRHGADLLERVYENRVVNLRLWIMGSSRDNLITNINAINAALERAAEYAAFGLGSQLLFRRQWDSATNASDFHVLEGVLTLEGETTTLHAKNNRIAAVLHLLCKPFVLGSAITASNYVFDPSFEIAGTALADWTENITATGTTARSTAQAKYGTASLLLTMTNSGASGQVVERTQVLTDVDAAEVWSYSAWINFTALSNAKAVLVALYNDGGATQVTVERTTVTSGWVQITLANQTVPAGATQVTLKLRLESTASSATGTLYFDGAMAVLASSVPEIFVSGRDVYNHYDDDGQAHINYVDIYGVPGDLPALCQIKLTENEAHTEFWAGARHSGRLDDGSIWIEGESTTDNEINTPANFTYSSNSTADAAASNGAMEQTELIRQVGSDAALVAGTYARHEFTISTLPEGQYRVLIRCGWSHTDAAPDPTALDFQFGLSWTYGAQTLLDDTNPATASFVTLPSGLAEDAYAILDLGAIKVPPAVTPDGMTAASLVLKIFERYLNASGAVFTGATGGRASWLLDAIFLLPVDTGMAYVSKTSAADVLLLDSRSRRQAVALLNTSDVIQSVPSTQYASAIEAHPNGTRVYCLWEASNVHTIANGAKATVIVVPRYLAVR